MRHFLFATVLLLPALAVADHEHAHEAAAPGEPPIKITINPEARVSVAVVGALPPATTCGAAIDLSVKIINQSFLTSRLEAELVDKPEGVTLDFRPEPLKGVLEEERELHITLVQPGSTDVTLSFRTHNNAPDLGGRDRLHLLMRCI